MKWLFMPLIREEFCLVDIPSEFLATELPKEEDAVAEMRKLIHNQREK